MSNIVTTTLSFTFQKVIILFLLGFLPAHGSENILSRFSPSACFFGSPEDALYHQIDGLNQRALRGLMMYRGYTFDRAISTVKRVYVENGCVANQVDNYTESNILFPNDYLSQIWLPTTDLDNAPNIDGRTEIEYFSSILNGGNASPEFAISAGTIVMQADIYRTALSRIIETASPGLSSLGKLCSELALSIEAPRETFGGNDNSTINIDKIPPSNQGIDPFFVMSKLGCHKKRELDPCPILKRNYDRYIGFGGRSNFVKDVCREVDYFDSQYLYAFGGGAARIGSIIFSTIGAVSTIDYALDKTITTQDDYWKQRRAERSYEQEIARIDKEIEALENQKDIIQRENTVLRSQEAANRNYAAAERWGTVITERVSREADTLSRAAKINEFRTQAIEARIGDLSDKRERYDERRQELSTINREIKKSNPDFIEPAVSQPPENIRYIEDGWCADPQKQNLSYTEFVADIKKSESLRACGIIPQDDFKLVEEATESAQQCDIAAVTEALNRMDLYGSPPAFDEDDVISQNRDASAETNNAYAQATSRAFEKVQSVKELSPDGILVWQQYAIQQTIRELEINIRRQTNGRRLVIDQLFGGIFVNGDEGVRRALEAADRESRELDDMIARLWAFRGLKIRAEDTFAESFSEICKSYSGKN